MILRRTCGSREIIIPVVPIERSFTPRVWEFWQYRAADRQDLTYRESSSLSFNKPMCYKCRSISTRRGMIYHPHEHSLGPFPRLILLSFLICLLLARIVSRVIASWRWSSWAIQSSNDFSKFVSREYMHRGRSILSIETLKRNGD